MLFDFGGAIADVHKRPDGYRAVAGEVACVLERAGFETPRCDEVETDLCIGAEAYEAWKKAQSRTVEPVEADPRRFWEFVTCDWPPAKREAVAAEAARLCERFELATLSRPAKPDARDTLIGLRERGIRTGLVCNCLSGDAARHQLDADGLRGLLDVERYSNETGVRKPNPAFVRDVARDLGVPVGETWFVGDKYDRDILGARRAGTGAAVLMSSPAGPGRPLPGLAADQVVDTLSELLDLVDRSEPSPFSPDQNDHGM